MTKSPSAAALQPPLDDRPGLQIVGERDRAEIVAERRAEPRRRRLHRDDAGRDRDVERAPFAARSSIASNTAAAIAKTPGIAARDDRDRAPFRRELAARGGRGRVRRDCRWRARAGPAARPGGRDKGRSRRCRSPPRSRRPPPASSIRRARGRARRSRRARSRPPPPAGHQDQREIGRGVALLLGRAASTTSPAIVARST